MSKAPRFQYRERSAEDVQARANNKGGAFDSWIKPNYKMYKVKEGKNIIRFLPPTWEDPNHYGYDIYINYNIGVDNSRYLSLSKMGKGRDPIAEAASQARREGDEKLAKELAPKYSVLAWVIDRTAEEEGPLLFRMPFTLDRDIATHSNDEDTKETFYIDKTGGEEGDGYDIRFYAIGAGKQKCEYPAAKIKLLAPSPLSPDQGQADEWLQYVRENPVPDCLQFYSYEHISNVFNGGQQKRPDEDVEDDEDQGAKPQRAVATANGEARGTRAPTRPVLDEDDEEDETPPPIQPKAAPASGGSIRERLAARHKVAPKRAELDDED